MPIVNYATVVERLNVAEAVGEERLVVGDEATQAQLHGALAHVELVLKRETVDSDVLVSPSDALTARFQSLVAERARSTGKVEPLLAGGHEVKFDRHDLAGWVLDFVPEWLAGRRRERFRELPAVEHVPDRLRLALFADWGTALYGSPHIAVSIANDPDGFDYVVHLGDVYYAGSESEFEANFVRLWPQPKHGAIGRTLNGNHEMYSGGRGYFQVGLPALEQPSSVFALQNKHWLLVGLDSAYDDFQLAHGQAEWLAGLVEGAGSRRVILFSHHQLFSNTAHEQGTHMQVKLAHLLQSRRVHAWYWGHEHICALYDPHPVWGVHGRCIGHAGMPEFRHRFDGEPEETDGSAMFYRLNGAGTNPSCLVLDGPNEFIPGHENHYMPHGYMTVTLDGSRIEERLHDPTGKVLREAVLP